jgi:hypothetical protein
MPERKECAHCGHHTPHKKLAPTVYSDLHSYGYPRVYQCLACYQVDKPQYVDTWDEDDEE